MKVTDLSVAEQELLRQKKAKGFVAAAQVARGDMSYGEPALFTSVDDAKAFVARVKEMGGTLSVKWAVVL